MAKRPTVTTVSSGYASNTQLNNNFTALRDAFDNTLSLDGSTPNAMGADLDLNNNDLLNASVVNTATLKVGGVNVVPSAATALAVKQEFDTVADLLASTLTYSSFAPNDYIRVVDGGHVYQVAASSASDQHVTTVGGVKLYAQPDQSGFVSATQFGAKGDGITNDTVAIQAAVSSGYSLLIPSGNFLISAQINVSTNGQQIRGAGWGSSAGGAVSRIFSSGDHKFFRVTGDYVHIRDILLDSTAANLSQPHIHLAGDDFGSVTNCRIAATENFSAVGGGILIDDGAGGVGGEVAIINDINVSHGTITVLRSDVHIKNSWVWANSRPYAIYSYGSVGNLVIEGCDVLPPRTPVSGRKAAIYLSGALSNPRILGCNFDGNLSLSTGSGLLAENGVLNLLVQGCYGFGHNEDCIILDSLIAPHIIGCTFKENNLSANGATDITLRETFTQDMERPLISGCSFTQTAAKVGTPGPAIKVSTGVTRKEIRIVDNTIFQPGLGGGYTDIEISLDAGVFASAGEGSLRGNCGSRTKYSASGNTSVLNTDTFKTISYPATMAYEPRPDQITLQYAATGAPPLVRFNSSGLPGTLNFGVGLHGTFNSGTLYFNVSL